MKMVSEYNPMLVRFYHHCKTCHCECGEGEGIIGCVRYMMPFPKPLEIYGEVYTSCCVKRIWFNKQYQPIRFWREPTEAEFNRLINKELSGEEWERTLQTELEKEKVETKREG